MAQDCYQLGTGCFAVYGIEYKPGYGSDSAYISWINDGKFAWTLNAAGVGAESETQITSHFSFELILNTTRAADYRTGFIKGTFIENNGTHA
ncbi:hypothetical protein IW262DRAFT_1391539 [Armillaria fumosa]|nr:hypothetical protein IW262DRAFT_1391539 [Armillaria fumosa]